ncbi:hypothetical protein [Paenibacillus popilliae]|uniref:FOG: Ankyrin repeat n=1 Tax=Paenibacillus popilliae ATCC 14706 TaxID=1212764 RepID=M9LBX2_PAEPP|nr:hypothetical protein [Paenibacillus popilliae]GAC43457.1 FOG: Ankyrin repeat [Paenibacillus popilliae ATCC 14706]
MGNEARLSQNTAILLERARRKGYTDVQLLRIIRSGDVSELTQVNEAGYSYDGFLTYAAEHGESLEQAVTKGYRMTFNTMNGLRIWLEMRFGIAEGVDFIQGEGKYTGLTLSEADLDALHFALAANWIILEEAEASGPKRTVTLAVRRMGSS